MLASQLVKSMVGESSTLGEGPYASTMQETLTTALTSGQGLGPRPPDLQGDAVVSTVLEAELLVHLDRQINSARQLLKLVLAQGSAIRERDTEAVLARLADIQSEMVRRGGLEQERTGLLQRAGIALGMPATNVTLERLCSLITPAAATAAMERSAELRGLLAEIAREHGINRALMRQELDVPVAPHPPDRPRGRAGLQPSQRRPPQRLPGAFRLPRSGPPGLTPPDI